MEYKLFFLIALNKFLVEYRIKSKTKVGSKLE